MPITHQDVADKMGVSRALVTKALHRSNGTRVSEQTRREVLRVAQQMGYQPRGVTTHNVGYVFSTGALLLETGVNFLMNVQNALSSQGSRLMLANFGALQAHEMQQMLTPKTVDGVLATQWYEGRIRHLLPAGVPWVLTSDEDDVATDVDLIAVDATLSATRAFEYLLGRGHRRFCLIMGAGEIKYHRQLKAGARAALHNSGWADVSLQVIEVFNNKEINLPLQTMMNSAHAPTAVVTANSGQTVPALHSLMGIGKQIPRDVSLLSILDGLQFEALHPTISATTASGVELAERAVARLTEKIRDPLSTPQKVLLAGEIIERESVAFPPAL